MENHELCQLISRLYVFEGEFQNFYFDAEEELELHVANSHDPKEFTDISIIEYLGSFAGKKDVIRKVNSDGSVKVYAACDCTQFYISDITDTENQEILSADWMLHDGSVADLYRAFRERGIIFEDDIYARDEKEEKEFIKTINDAFKKIFF